MNKNSIDTAEPYTIINVNVKNSAPNKRKIQPEKTKLQIRHNIDKIVFLEKTTKKLKTIIININIIKYNIFLFFYLFFYLLFSFNLLF
jgi:hypothetical protein